MSAAGSRRPETAPTRSGAARRAQPAGRAGPRRPRTVTGYARACGPQWADVVARLRQIIRRAAPAASEELRWGTPWYSQDGLVCYFSVGKSHVTFGFRRGGQLADPDGLFKGTGKVMRHVKIRTAADIRGRQFARWVREAVRINRQSSSRD